MNEESYKEILNRHECMQDLNEHFSESLELLREIVNYGTNLVPRFFVSSDRALPDVVISTLLTHAMAMLDGVEILSSQGAIIAAHVPARALFEARLYIEWILKKDREKRARQYYCWIIRKEKFWALRFIPGTEEHEKYANSAESLGVKETTQKLEKKALKNFKRIEKNLDSEKFANINAEFDRTNRNGYDRPWFSLNGPSSLADLSVRLGCKGEYDTFYSIFSDIAHSQAFDRHVLFKKNALNFKKIRNLEGIGTLLYITISFSIYIYKLILEQYRPGELSNLTLKYKTEWRKRFRNIKHVKYNHICHRHPL